MSFITPFLTFEPALFSALYIASLEVHCLCESAKFLSQILNLLFLSGKSPRVRSASHSAWSAQCFRMIIMLIPQLVKKTHQQNYIQSGTMYHFFKSTFFNFEYTRVLTTIPFGGAEIGECLDAATQIKNDDPESWHRAWYTQAERAETLAHAAASRGDAISARDAYLRAANYFRASQYMFNDRLDSPEARVLPLFNRSVANFLHAIKLLDHSVQLLQIPYENDHTLPGYLFLPHPSKRLPGKIPVLVNCNGADSTSEELYSLYPAAGCDRGYAVVSFDGPGQGMVLRQDKLRMRPDWEVVTSRVLDHIHELAKTQPELDLDIDRVAVAGASMYVFFPFALTYPASKKQ